MEVQVVANGHGGGQMEIKTIMVGALGMENRLSRDHTLNRSFSKKKSPLQGWRVGGVAVIIAVVDPHDDWLKWRDWMS